MELIKKLPDDVLFWCKMNNIPEHQTAYPLGYLVLSPDESKITNSVCKTVYEGRHYFEVQYNALINKVITGYFSNDTSFFHYIPEVERLVDVTEINRFRSKFDHMYVNTKSMNTYVIDRHNVWRMDGDRHIMLTKLAINRSFDMIQHIADYEGITDITDMYKKCIPLEIASIKHVRGSY